jgi:hypothetical protein
MLQVFLQITRNMCRISCTYISGLLRIGIGWSDKAASGTARRGK